MRVLPNMTVLAPSDAAQTKKIVELMAETPGPMYARVGRANAPVVYTKEDLKHVELGKGMMIKDGSDVSIIACGTMVDQAMDAWEQLTKQGISTRVVDIHTIKPIDIDLILKCARDTKGIITAEEHSVIGGLGGAVGEILAEQGSRVRLKRIGVNDTFCESGEPDELFKKYGLSAEHLVQAAKKIIK